MRRRTPGTRRWASRCWAVTALCPCRTRPSPPARWSSSPAPSTTPRPKSAAVLRCTCVRNKTGTPRGCGLSSFCRQETWQHSARSLLPCGSPVLGGDSFCGVPSSLQVRHALASVSQMGKPRPKGDSASQVMTPGQWSSLLTMALQPIPAAVRAPFYRRERQLPDPGHTNHLVA